MGFIGMILPRFGRFGSIRECRFVILDEYDRKDA